MFQKRLSLILIASQNYCKVRDIFPKIRKKKQVKPGFLLGTINARCGQNCDLVLMYIKCLKETYIGTKQKLTESSGKTLS